MLSIEFTFKIFSFSKILVVLSILQRMLTDITDIDIFEMYNEDNIQVTDL